MKLLLLVFTFALTSFSISEPRFQKDADYSAADLKKLAAEIKTLLDKYPTALATYKGALIKDSTAGGSKWFRLKKKFSLASQAAIEDEEGNYRLYLNFKGFSNTNSALGMSKRLIAFLRNQTYAFGKLKEVASGEDGLIQLDSVNPTDKFDGVSIYIHVPDVGGLPDRFGDKRENDVVVYINLPSK